MSPYDEVLCSAEGLNNVLKLVCLCFVFALLGFAWQMLGFASLRFASLSLSPGFRHAFALLRPRSSLPRLTYAAFPCLASPRLSSPRFSLRGLAWLSSASLCSCAGSSDGCIGPSLRVVHPTTLPFAGSTAASFFSRKRPASSARTPTSRGTSPETRAGVSMPEKPRG